MAREEFTGQSAFVEGAAGVGTEFPVNPVDGRFFIRTDESGSDGTWNTVTITSDTTLTLANTYVRCDCTSQAITVTFPAVASRNGRRFIVKKIDGTSNSVTIVGTGTDKVELSTTAELATQGESVGFIGVSAALNWDIFMAYQPFPTEILNFLLDAARISAAELQKLTVQAAVITDLPDVTGDELT